MHCEGNFHLYRRTLCHPTEICSTCYAVETQVCVKSLISISNKPDHRSEKTAKWSTSDHQQFNSTNPLSNSDTIIFYPLLVKLSLKSTKVKIDSYCWICVVSYSSNLTCQKAVFQLFNKKNQNNLNSISGNWITGTLKFKVMDAELLVSLHAKNDFGYDQ